MSSFVENGSINNRYEVINCIRDDAFGEYYAVKDTDQKNKRKDFLLFSVEGASANKHEFSAFCAKVKQFYIRHTRKPGIYVDSTDSMADPWQDNIKNRLFFRLVFPENALSSRLADEIGWVESEFRAVNPMPAAKAVEVVRQLAEHLLSAEDIEQAYTYISPDTVCKQDGSYLPIIPYFHLILKRMRDHSGDEIRSVLLNNPRLKCFPLAPELATARHIEPELVSRAPVWSLGILFYILVEGKLPFHFQSVKDYLGEIASGKMQFISDVPPEYLPLLSGALAPEPKERFTLSRFLEKLKELKVGAAPAAPAPEAAAPVEEPILPWITSPDAKPIYNLEPGTGDQQFTVELYPSRFPSQTQLEKETIHCLIRCKALNFTSEGHVRELKIDIHPAPQFELIDEESFLRYRGENKYEGRVQFRILRSKVKIQNISLALSETSAAEPIEIQTCEYSRYGQIQGVTALNEKLFFEFSFTSEHPLTDKVILMQCQFDLAGHRPIRLEKNLKVEFPARIDSHFDLRTRLTALVHSRQPYKISFFNSGGNPLKITKVFITPEIPVFSLLVKEDVQQWLKSGDIPFELSCVIDASGYSNPANFSGDLVFHYSEKYNGELFEREQKFPLNVQIKTGIRTNKIAVDFGTTNSCIAVCVDNGQYIVHTWKNEEMYALSQGDRNTVPSFIYYDTAGNEPRIGDQAMRQYLGGDFNTFHSFKRLLGKDLTENILIGDKLVIRTYEQITSDYLRVILNAIRNETGSDLSQFVFTHPTNLSSKSDRVFRDIVNSIGLVNKPEDVTYIDEATAGILHYIKEFGHETQAYMVYDFGGGTTDIVFAEYRNIKAAESDWWRSDQKSVKRVFSTGYNYGGTDITLTIIEEIRKWYLAKHSRMIPFIEPGKKNSLPPGVTKAFKDICDLNNGTLWEIAEKIKYSILNEGANFESEFKRIHYAQGVSLDDPSSWSITAENLATRIDEYSAEDFLEIKRAVFQETGKQLESRIRNVLDFCYKHTGYADKPFVILLLGRSSNYKMVEDLFRYYVCGEDFPSKSYLGFKPKYEPFKFSTGCHPVKPEELKHLVAIGALEYAADTSLVLDDSLTQKAYSLNKADGQKLFRAGLLKMNNGIKPNELLRFLSDQDDSSGLAFHCFNKFVSLSKDILFSIYENSVFESTVAGSFTVPAVNSGVSVDLCLYMTMDNVIHWFTYTSDFDIVNQGRII